MTFNAYKDPLPASKEDKNNVISYWSLGDVFCEAPSSHLHCEVKEMDWMVSEGPLLSFNSLGDRMQLKRTSACVSEDTCWASAPQLSDIPFCKTWFTYCNIFECLRLTAGMGVGGGYSIEQDRHGPLLIQLRKADDTYTVGLF